MKMQKKTDLQIIQDHVEVAVNEVNKVIEELGEQSISLYDTLTNIQELFDKIRNVPSKRNFKLKDLIREETTGNSKRKKLREIIKKRQIKI